MQLGLHFNLLYRDNDLLKIRAVAWNGSYAGTTDIYESPNRFDEVAKQLQGFPAKGDDVREVELGTFDRNLGGGGLKLQFHCLDRLGHVQVHVRIASKSDGPEGTQSVLLQILTEPASIDRFLSELRSLASGRQDNSFLSASG